MLGTLDTSLLFLSDDNEKCLTKLQALVVTDVSRGELDVSPVQKCYTQPLSAQCFFSRSPCQAVHSQRKYHVRAMVNRDLFPSSVLFRGVRRRRSYETPVEKMSSPVTLVKVFWCATVVLSS